jgi:phosphate transport system substrate-binding protein
MKKTVMLSLLLVASILITGALLPASEAAAQQVLRYASSAQVREALGDAGLKAFKDKTGIEVDLFVGTSATALNRLFNGVADIASSAERLYRSHEEYGYRETVFCKVPLVVIVNAGVAVADLSEDQLRAIFTGEAVNWKEMGGPDQEIIVVVPGRNTAAFKNFSQLAIKRAELKYDFMTYRSTMVAQAVKRIPGSISFIVSGPETKDPNVRVIKVDGRAPSDPAYPYMEEFSFVTKGEPEGAAKKLVDFVRSPEFFEMMKAQGVMPVKQ